LQNYYGNDAMPCFELELKFNFNPMKHLGGIGIAWFMLSGYPGLHTWLSTQDLCGCHRLGVHLWMATQGQRDYHVFLA
jgi:hypothetical protein